MKGAGPGLRGSERAQEQGRAGANGRRLTGAKGRRGPGRGPFGVRVSTLRRARIHPSACADPPRIHPSACAYPPRIHPSACAYPPFRVRAYPPFRVRAYPPFRVRVSTLPRARIHPFGVRVSTLPRCAYPRARIHPALVCFDAEDVDDVVGVLEDDRAAVVRRPDRQVRQRRRGQALASARVGRQRELLCAPKQSHART